MHIKMGQIIFIHSFLPIKINLSHFILFYLYLLTYGHPPFELSSDFVMVTLSAAEPSFP